MIISEKQESTDLYFVTVSLSRIVYIVLMAIVLVACKDEMTSVVKHPTDPEKVPTMTSHDVQTVISDDGRTRYRIETDVWQMFEEAKEPHWIFPRGVKAEELDSEFNSISSIKCDSAYYDENSQIWDLHGHVNITNSDGDVILTDQLFWNQMTHRLYSDAFIHIEKQGRVIEGYGYESNEQFSTYTLRQVEAIFPVDESRFRSTDPR